LGEAVARVLEQSRRTHQSCGSEILLGSGNAGAEEPAHESGGYHAEPSRQLPDSGQGAWGEKEFVEETQAIIVGAHEVGTKPANCDGLDGGGHFAMYNVAKIAPPCRIARIHECLYSLLPQRQQ